jgi:hypothetical protein
MTNTITDVALTFTNDSLPRYWSTYDYNTAMTLACARDEVGVTVEMIFTDDDSIISSFHPMSTIAEVEVVAVIATLPAPTTPMVMAP